MTIIEAQGTLLNFFLENEHFDPREDFDSVVSKESITRSLDKAIIIAGLELLEEKEVVCSVCLDEKGEPVVWVLTQPLNMRSQTVELSFPVASALVNTLNSVSIASGGKAIEEVFSLNEGSIASLIAVVHHLLAPTPDGNAK